MFPLATSVLTVFSSCFACSLFDIVSLCVSLSKLLKSPMLSISELPSVAAFCFGKIFTSFGFLRSGFCSVEDASFWRDFDSGSFFTDSGTDLDSFDSEIVSGFGFRALFGRDVLPEESPFLGVGGSGDADCDFILSLIQF